MHKPMLAIAAGFILSATPSLAEPEGPHMPPMPPMARPASPAVPAVPAVPAMRGEPGEGAVPAVRAIPAEPADRAEPAESAEVAERAAHAATTVPPRSEAMENYPVCSAAVRDGCINRSDAARRGDMDNPRPRTHHRSHHRRPG